MKRPCTACSWNSPRDRSADTTDSAWLAAALAACTMFLPMYSYTPASTATSTSSLATRRQPPQAATRRQLVLPRQLATQYQPPGDTDLAELAPLARVARV